MPDKANDPLPGAPELNEAAEAIARGRELVKQAQRLREEAERQIEEVQTTLTQADRTLDRSQQLLGDKLASHAPSATGAPPDEEA
jgi:exonuclease VII small subunit